MTQGEYWGRDDERLAAPQARDLRERLDAAVQLMVDHDVPQRHANLWKADRAYKAAYKAAKPRPAPPDELHLREVERLTARVSYDTARVSYNTAMESSGLLKRYVPSGKRAREQTNEGGKQWKPDSELVGRPAGTKKPEQLSWPLLLRQMESHKLDQRLRARRARIINELEHSPKLSLVTDGALVQLFGVVRRPKMPWFSKKTDPELRLQVETLLRVADALVVREQLEVYLRKRQQEENVRKGDGVLHLPSLWAFTKNCARAAGTFNPEDRAGLLEELFGAEDKERAEKARQQRASLYVTVVIVSDD